MPSNTPHSFKPVSLPALRGSFGDWTYYSVVMTLKELAARVSFAEAIHPNKALSELIQRSLKQGRAKQIAEYLRDEDERFFNSLVVAVYDGAPQWVPLEVAPPKGDEPVLGGAAHCLGVLKLSGEEKLFAVDGQHRLAGMKHLVETARASAKLPALNDLVSVLFIAHRTDQVARTRRLFTTLNKTAIPVSKMERIALDENDSMAIIARQLVEDDQAFKAPRIAMHHTNNLGHDEAVALTTIGNLYDVLRLLFIAETGQKKRELEYERPDDETLASLFDVARGHFRLLARIEPGLAEYFRTSDPETVCKQYRHEDGGSIYFRPLGLTLMTEAAMKLKASSPRDWKKWLALLPRELSERPFAGTIWSHRGTIEPKHYTLCRNLLLYMCGSSPEDREELQERYREVMGERVQLPRRLTLE